MKGFVWVERRGGGYDRYGPYQVDVREPSRVVNKFVRDDPLGSSAWSGIAGGLTPGDRVSIGSTVWESGEFGMWENIASGPAGDGLVGAMEDTL